MKSIEEAPTIRPTTMNTLQDRHRLLMFERLQAQAQQEQRGRAPVGVLPVPTNETGSTGDRRGSIRQQYRSEMPVCARSMILSRRGRTGGIDRARLIEVLNEALLISKEIMDQDSTAENNVFEDDQKTTK